MFHLQNLCKWSLGKSEHTQRIYAGLSCDPWVLWALTILLIDSLHNIHWPHCMLSDKMFRKLVMHTLHHTTHHTTPHHTTHHTTPYHITPHITPHHITPHHITTSHHITLHHITPLHLSMNNVLQLVKLRFQGKGIGQLLVARRGNSKARAVSCATHTHAQ